MNRKLVAERMKEQVDFTRELAEETAGPLPKYVFKWSKRLSRSAGRIIWHAGWTEIKLSSKIFFKAVEDLGIDKACEEIHQTFLHELGHLIVDHPGHGYDWEEAVRSMGGTPTRYHSLKSGVGMIDSEVREQFTWGTQVQFACKGRSYTGKVVKHNPKNMKVRCDGVGYFNIPWRLVEQGGIKKVQEA